jgi:hypothetical protein
MKIEDKLIKPYSILKESHSYDVVKDTGRKDKAGKIVYEYITHHSSVENALKKIVKLKAESKKTFTIKDYIAELKRVNNSITDLI